MFPPSFGSNSDSVSIDNFSDSSSPAPISPVLSVPTLPIRKSLRVKHKLNYPQDFHCQLDTSSLSPPCPSPSILGIPYAFSSVISYNKLSPLYKHYVLSVSTSI
jgi:hypothetical protein